MHCLNCGIGGIVEIFDDGMNSRVEWCNHCGLVKVYNRSEKYRKESGKGGLITFHLSRVAQDNIIPLPNSDPPEVLGIILDAMDADVLNDEAYSDQEVSEEIRRAGGDPEAIGKRGQEQAKELLDKIAACQDAEKQRKG